MTNTVEFTTHSEYVGRFNGHTIWYKYLSAKKDAGKYVVLSGGKQNNVPCDDLMDAILLTLQSPHPITGNSFKNLTVHKQGILSRMLIRNGYNGFLGFAKQYINAT